MAFGRRRQEEEPAAETAEVAEVETAEVSGTGPWDAATDEIPELERIDFGSIQVPIGQGIEVQVNLEAAEVDEEGNPVGGRIVAVTVVTGESAMQLQAFAAPKRAGIWDEIRKETAQEIAENAQGQTQEAEGPFGTELHALIPAPLTEEILEQMPEEMRASIPQEVIDQGYAWQPAKFIGVDGSRWFLRAVVTGAAVEDEEQWQVLEDVFSQIVVNRGEHPMPPRELLEFTLPTEAQQAMAEADGDDDEGIDPFTRGPEISEVR
ncbi:DUF3710 domain-containing protein [Actinocorallia longicatena]|uniref:DUF3710 domain-containing protein n=1 Tax=Actinocorallia longicatena TaxID=111803 RepID=A0ABP6QF96_9ACTN